MTTRMLINATVPNELRIAIVEDGELTELDIETNDQNQIKGNIYKGVVHNVEASLAAAFVDIGGHKQGFLPFDEISSEVYGRKWDRNGESPRITDVIKRGQEIVVQVQKDAIGEKGATLTTRMSLPGRFTVLLPGSDANGVSRKIEDETARKKIRAVAAKIERPEDCGFIVRTAGLGQPRAAIQKDLDSVIAIYEKVQKSAAIAHAPSLLYAEPDLISRTLRDFYTDDIEEIWIDSREEYEAARQYFQELMPDSVEVIQWYQNPIPIFAYHHVEEQIEATFHRTVPLPSGGSIVIDETEALVAIDVNSGKMTSERDHEDTVYKTNLEAAEEVARQLKLRDLGGIIVIDFIDMELHKNERLVEKALADVAKRDKARYKISKINAQGLCVLTRQRIRQGLRRAFQRRCQTCAGTGWLRTPESHSISLLRRVETRLAQGGVGEVRVATHRETAEYLLNFKRSELMALEREHHCRIVVSAKPEMDRNADDVVYLSKGEILAEITNLLPPREERRLDRGAKRKARKKKRAQIAAQGGEVEALDEEISERPSKRRRRSRRGRDRQDEVIASGDVETTSDIGESSDLPGPAERERPERAPVEPGRFDGTGAATFTGRPPPEVLERLRAERRARMGGQRPGPRPASGGVEQSSSPPAPSRASESSARVEPYGEPDLGSWASKVDPSGSDPDVRSGSPEQSVRLPVAHEPAHSRARDAGSPREAHEPPADHGSDLGSRSGKAGPPMDPSRSDPADPGSDDPQGETGENGEPRRSSLLERLRGLRRTPTPPPPQDNDA
jgi:ribonuclease E